MAKKFYLIELWEQRYKSSIFTLTPLTLITFIPTNIFGGTWMEVKQALNVDGGGAPWVFETVLRLAWALRARSYVDWLSDARVLEDLLRNAWGLAEFLRVARALIASSATDWRTGGYVLEGRFSFPLLFLTGVVDFDMIIFRMRKRKTLFDPNHEPENKTKKRNSSFKHPHIRILLRSSSFFHTNYYIALVILIGISIVKSYYIDMMQKWRLFSPYVLLVWSDSDSKSKGKRFRT